MLTEPNASWGGGCQASMITVGSTIFFCNPNNEDARQNLEIRYSTDYGQIYQNLVTLEEGNGGYSSLTYIPSDHSLGVLYETGLELSNEYIAFKKIYLNRYYIPKSEI